MSKKMTFWNLVKDNNIEIPIIQREYAQGRKDDRIKEIRKKIIHDLTDSIKNGAKSHFGFVYGKTEKRENDAETLIPLDGQQRLTTLYLYHWYLIRRLEQKKDFEFISKFSYNTRESSKKFCKEISNPNNEISFKDKNLRKTLENKLWFRQAWLTDSTVNGMLETLNDIHNHLFSSDKNSLEALLEKLQNENTISFDFLDLEEDLSQTDDLYIKMNARGEQLTDFEHFKSWLIQLIKDKKWKFEFYRGKNKFDWSNFIDIEWMDLFWNSKPENTFNVDFQFFKFIKEVLLMHYLGVNKSNLSDEEKENLTRKIRNDYFVSLTDLKEKDFFNKESIGFLFNSLMILSDSSKSEKIKDWLEEVNPNKIFFDKEIQRIFIKPKSESKYDYSYPESLIFFSLLLYLDTIGYNESDKDNFIKWMRLCRNFISNSTIDSYDRYIRSSESIFYLSKQFLNNGTLNKISFFNEEQRKEELIKRELIQQFNDIDDYVRKFEDHYYFKGRIGWLIDFTTGNDYNNSKSYNINNFDKFKFIEYGEIFSGLFGEPVLNNDYYYLQRALLCHGDYLPKSKKGGNYIMPSSKAGTFRIRDSYWLKVLENKDGREFIGNFIDNKIKGIKITSYPDFLADVIGATIKNNATNDNWRKLFINSPETISYCFRGDKSLGYLRFGVKGDDNDIRILLTSSLGGTNNNLNLVNLFKKELEHKLSSSFVEWFNFHLINSTTSAFPHIKIDGINQNSKRYHIGIFFIQGQYRIIYKYHKEFGDMTQIENELKNSGYASNNEGYLERIEKTQFNLIEHLQKLLNELKKYSILLKD